MKIRQKKEQWKLVVPKDTVSPTNSIHELFDIVIQTCCISHVRGSRTMWSAGPFTLRWKTKSGKIVEKSAKLT